MFLLVVLAAVVLASSGIQSGKASDFYVRNLPGFADGAWLPEMHAGLIEVGSKMSLGESSLFFWHMRASQHTNRTIVWLNGGPGCSSMDGALIEISPFRFDEAGKLKNNEPGNWLELGNLLFIDQPFGTGYSDPGEEVPIKSVEEAAEGVTIFLEEYAKIFPEFLDTEILLAGESFAGQYIPHIWKRLQLNRNSQENFTTKLAGAVLINPWVNPIIQSLNYAQFIKDNGLVPQEKYAILNQLQEKCMSQIQSETSPGPSFRSCEDILSFLGANSGKTNKECVNLYDASRIAKMPGCGSEWPSELGSAAKWLERADVREALHVPPLKNGEKWNECSSYVSKHLKSGEHSNKFLGTLIEDIPLLIMVGRNDIICNHIGIRRLVEQLEWAGSIGFSDQATDTTWGDWQSERKLTVANVANASHMVPFDHLKESQMVLQKWLGFDDKGNESDSKDGDEDQGNEDIRKPSQEEIDKAMYRAYKQAGVVALVVVLIVVAILGLIWWKQGQGMSIKGFLSAILHFNISKITKKRKEYIPLQRMTRRPSMIVEEDESDEYVL